MSGSARAIAIYEVREQLDAARIPVVVVACLMIIGLCNATRPDAVCLSPNPE
jgi:hypothetical protein